MKINMYILFFIFLLGCLQFTDCKTCFSSITGPCATLTCPSPTCKKNPCTQLNAALIAGLRDMGYGICGVVLLVIAVVVTVKFLRSRQNYYSSSNVDSLKRETTRINNSYPPRLPGFAPPPTIPRFFPGQDPRFPPIPDPENEYEPIIYELDHLQGKDNPLKATTENEDGYLVPNPLDKPNLPIPRVPILPTE